jgi:hypothetical protein
LIRSANSRPGSPADLVAALKAKRSGASSSRRKSAKLGSRYEDEADRLNAECKAAGVADVQRVASNLKVIRHLPNGHVEAVPVRKSCLDVRGWFLDPQGQRARAITVEVKGVALEVDAARRPLPVSFGMSHVRPDQVEKLDEAVRDGVLAILLVIHGLPPMSTAYAVPWAEVQKSRLRTLNAEFLAPWRVGREPYLKRFLSAEVSR